MSTNTSPGSTMTINGEMSPLRSSTTTQKSGLAWLSPHSCPICLEGFLSILFSTVSSSVWKAEFAQLAEEGHFGWVIFPNVLYQPFFFP